MTMSRRARRGGSSAVQWGQTVTEYVLLVALFMVPISAYFWPKLLKVVYNMFRTLAIDLSGPGI